MSNTWFRFYHETLDDPKVQRLPGETYKAWVNLLCLACRNDGKIPSVADVAFALRTSEQEVGKLLKYLAGCALLDCAGNSYTPHGWTKRQYKSDVSTDRVKRFRNGDGNVAETLHETDQRQSRPEQIQNPKEVVDKVVVGLSPNKKPWTTQQRRAAWQSGVLNYAQTRLTAEKYTEFVAAWADEKGWANDLAEQYSREMKAGKTAQPPRQRAAHAP